MNISTAALGLVICSTMFWGALDWPVTSAVSGPWAKASTVQGLSIGEARWKSGAVRIGVAADSGPYAGQAWPGLYRSAGLGGMERYLPVADAQGSGVVRGGEVESRRGENSQENASPNLAPGSYPHTQDRVQAGRGSVSVDPYLLRPPFVGLGEADGLFQIPSVKSEADMSWPLPPDTYRQSVENSERNSDGQTDDNGALAIRGDSWTWASVYALGGLLGRNPGRAQDSGAETERSVVSDRSGSDDMARMVFDTPDPGAVDARLRVGVQLDRSRVEAVARTLTVRLTYYTDRGTTRWGCEAGPGIVATDPEIIPPRSVIRFDGREWLACDTGGFSNAWLDVWVASEAEGRDLARRYGKYTEIEIMEIER